MITRGVVTRGVMVRSVIARGVLTRGVIARGVITRGVVAGVGAFVASLHICCGGHSSRRRARLVYGLCRGNLSGRKKLALARQ